MISKISYITQYWCDGALLILCGSISLLGGDRGCRVYAMNVPGLIHVHIYSTKLSFISLLKVFLPPSPFLTNQNCVRQP